MGQTELSMRSVSSVTAAPRRTSPFRLTDADVYALVANGVPPRTLRDDGVAECARSGRTRPCGPGSQRRCVPNTPPSRRELLQRHPTVAATSPGRCPAATDAGRRPIAASTDSNVLVRRLFAAALPGSQQRPERVCRIVAETQERIELRRLLVLVGTGEEPGLFSKCTSMQRRIECLTVTGDAPAVTPRRRPSPGSAAAVICAHRASCRR